MTVDVESHLDAGVAHDGLHPLGGKACSMNRLAAACRKACRPYFARRTGLPFSSVTALPFSSTSGSATPQVQLAQAAGVDVAMVLDIAGAVGEHQAPLPLRTR